MLDANAIARMKRGARVVNCARGGIVDELALAEAIRSGHIAGAAFDVFEKEPPENNELLELDQVVATPHPRRIHDRSARKGSATYRGTNVGSSSERSGRERNQHAVNHC